MNFGELVMTTGLETDLKRIVGSQNVSTEKGNLDRYSGDALGVYRAFRVADRLFTNPAVIVWPLETSQVSQVLKYAQLNRVPVVPYGSGTGVMGAASPVDSCILLNMQRMNSVNRISKEDMTAELQPGVVLENAANAMNECGLVLGHDPWSRPIASVGGAISTNGMGYMAAKYGSMGEQVLGLEAVLPDGEIIRTKNVPKPSYGPNLNSLFIGAEGTLGVVTSATLRAFAMPEKHVLRCFDFPNFESGFNAIAQMYAEGVRPTMIDYGDEAWEEDRSGELEATVYLAFTGFAEDVDAHVNRTAEICRRFDGRQGDQEEVERFWKTRHASGERYKRNVIDSSNPGKARRERSSYRMDYLHVALPVSRVLEYRRKCQKLFSDNQVRVREWSIWGRPEFFSFLIVDNNEDEEHDTSTHLGEVVDSVLILAQRMGGTMEYCHGVGLKLAHLMESEMGSGYSVVKRLKNTLDPANILNPGKLI
jgi:FAD/FMN-containing dehydrogenase